MGKDFNERLVADTATAAVTALARMKRSKEISERVRGQAFLCSPTIKTEDGFTVARLLRRRFLFTLRIQQYPAVLCEPKLTLFTTSSTIIMSLWSD